MLTFIFALLIIGSFIASVITGSTRELTEAVLSEPVKRSGAVHISLRRNVLLGRAYAGG